MTSVRELRRRPYSTPLPPTEKHPRTAMCKPYDCACKQMLASSLTRLAFGFEEGVEGLSVADPRRQQGVCGAFAFSGIARHSHACKHQSCSCEHLMSTAHTLFPRKRAVRVSQYRTICKGARRVTAARVRGAHFTVPTTRPPNMHASPCSWPSCKKKVDLQLERPTVSDSRLSRAHVQERLLAAACCASTPVNGVLRAVINRAQHPL
jgi:hypothetical protein